MSKRVNNKRGNRVRRRISRKQSHTHTKVRCHSKPYQGSTLSSIHDLLDRSLFRAPWVPEMKAP